MINYKEFSSIFCRGIFKQAIIRGAETFEEHMNAKRGCLKDLNLRQKIDMYKREMMKNGLMAEDGSDYNKEIKNILDSLNQYEKSGNAV